MVGVRGSRWCRAPQAPPPPPAPRHRGPYAALWLGGRLGYFSPFGKIGYDDPNYGTGPDWRDYATAGPSFELNVGGRFSRRYVVYGLWQTVGMGLGRDDAVANRPAGAQKSANTQLLGLGIRWTSDPDEVGFLIDFALGYRTFRAEFDDGAKFDMTSPIEARIGLGAEFRVSHGFTLSPMAMISNGVFSEMSFDVPGAVGTVSLFSYFAEAKWKFATAWWLSARWNQQLYGDITAPNGAQVTWDNDVWRAEAGIGWRVDRSLTVKAQYSYAHQDGPVDQGENLFDLQLVFGF